MSKMINGQEPITKNVIRKLRESFPLLNINWLLYDDGEMFLTAEDKNLRMVDEPEVEYLLKKDDPFWDVRSLLEQYERRIAVLEYRVDQLERKE